MTELENKPVRVLAVWEPVLFTDWSSPSTATLDRISTTRAAQFWDRPRVISHMLGEHDGRGIVWDYIAVYPAGATWEDRERSPLFHGGLVVRVIEQARAALTQTLNSSEAMHSVSK